MRLRRRIAAALGAVLAVIAISAGVTVGIATYFPELLPTGPRGAQGPAGAQGGHVGRGGGLVGPVDAGLAAESDLAAAALSLAVTSSGRVKNIVTHRLFDSDQSADMLTKAKAAVEGYRAPGDWAVSTRPTKARMALATWSGASMAA